MNELEYASFVCEHPELAKQFASLTAKQATDYIIAAGDKPAASYCRSLTDIRAGGCDLPLFFDLLNWYCEGDNLDYLDDTLSQYPAGAWGQYGHYDSDASYRIRATSHLLPSAQLGSSSTYVLRLRPHGNIDFRTGNVSSSKSAGDRCSPCYELVTGL